jgi:hypothetical protein
MFIQRAKGIQKERLTETMAWAAHIKESIRKEQHSDKIKYRNLEPLPLLRQEPKRQRTRVKENQWMQ